MNDLPSLLDLNPVKLASNSESGSLLKHNLPNELARAFLVYSHGGKDLESPARRWAVVSAHPATKKRDSRGQAEKQCKYPLHSTLPHLLADCYLE